MLHICVYRRSACSNKKWQFILTFGAAAWFLVAAHFDFSHSRTSTIKIHAQDPYKPNLRPVPPFTNHTFVIIFSTMRRGSSFLGELFNQNPQVFYLYEPLHPFNSDKQPERVQLLRSLLKCDFEQAMSMYENAEDKEADWEARCADERICFQARNRFVRRRPEHCLIEQRDCNDACRCERFSAVELSRSCRQTPRRAAKIVNERRVSALRPLVDDALVSVRVIHLVRDPRATVVSQLLANAWQKRNAKSAKRRRRVAATNFTAIARTECRILADNLKYLRSDGVAWKHQYMRVRYEDACRAPVAVARRVYDFAGWRFPAALEEWVVGSTSGEHAKTPFGTQRDAMRHVGAWRAKLGWRRTRFVQEWCAPQMAELGYRLVRDEKHLLRLKDDLWFT